MRKKLLEDQHQYRQKPECNWLNLEELADVELSSEDVSHPIEAALLEKGQGGWRASTPGTQTIRLLFSSPQKISRIHLDFLEHAAGRTQEFVLRWSSDSGQSFREIVRQQWNFSPSGTTSETEDYDVDLANVTALELNINPDIANPNAMASLEQWRIA